MPSPTTVAYHVPHTQLQNFGNISLPKESKSIGGQPYPDWVVHYRNLLLCHLPRRTAKAWMADGKELADGKVADSSSVLHFYHLKFGLHVSLYLENRHL